MLLHIQSGNRASPTGFPSIFKYLSCRRCFNGASPLSVSAVQPQIRSVSSAVSCSKEGGKVFNPVQLLILNSLRSDDSPMFVGRAARVVHLSRERRESKGNFKTIAKSKALKAFGQGVLSSFPTFGLILNVVMLGQLQSRIPYESGSTKQESTVASTVALKCLLVRLSAAFVWSSRSLNLKLKKVCKSRDPTASSILFSEK